MIASLKSNNSSQMDNHLLLELVESNKQIMASNILLLERMNSLESALNKTTALPLINTTTNFGHVKPCYCINS